MPIIKGDMTRRINYEDDIFTLALQVRCLQDVLKLEIDAEFFRDHIISDIEWIDSTIGRIQQGLFSSSLFVKRQEHLREIQKLKRAFIDVLGSLIDNRAPFAEYLTDRREELRGMRDASEKDIEEIKAFLAGQVHGSQEEEHMVSAEELKFLMTPQSDDGI